MYLHWINWNVLLAWNEEKQSPLCWRYIWQYWKDWLCCICRTSCKTLWNISPFPAMFWQHSVMVASLYLCHPLIKEIELTLTCQDADTSILYLHFKEVVLTFLRMLCFSTYATWKWRFNSSHASISNWTVSSLRAVTHNVRLSYIIREFTELRVSRARWRNSVKRLKMVQNWWTCQRPNLILSPARSSSTSVRWGTVNLSWETNDDKTSYFFFISASQLHQILYIMQWYDE